MKKISRAIISLTDKKGVAEFAKELANFGVEILSTGGTADVLKKAGIKVVNISDYTGFPEMLDGRVKTLHPKIAGGILGMRGKKEHCEQMEKHGILPIDMVVVNLYAFEDTIAKGASFEDAIENIDIGGPTMIRAAAKNYKDVAVVTDPNDYGKIIDEMKQNSGAVSDATKLYLAKRVFQLTARYDAAISNYLGSVEPKQDFPDTFSIQFKKAQDLRYGENPHQRAAFYRDLKIEEPCVSNARQLQGKELSFNNILDLNSAIELAKDFHEIACVIIKHNNPCGVAMSHTSLHDAYLKAYSCDKTSAFGGVVGFNRKVDAKIAQEMSKIFLEAVIAPGFAPGFDNDAIEILKNKNNLRLLEIETIPSHIAPPKTYEFKRVNGGLLIQTWDKASVTDLKTVTKREPSEKELEELLFAWKVCKHVKSNAIIFANNGQTIGIGAGQMSRIDSTRIGIMKATDAGFNVKGSVMASDAFFPFRDNVDKAAETGVTAIIQPGGSIRDEDVIKAADEHDIAMVFTGIRHFRH
ncbi:MAG: bifunctional phosphoribosylaminoimidazolecarboxamide formyltransferase/IMP cyclohydrolase [Deltaproteobacteria bacterium]|nr:bifunctional phosphoribosylaminoimidazolecarboxamide formyltransferase/IMP cyclohydrolase [Deltaproteobacteria bacterium]